ncbi:MAG: hypothetical protein OT643_03030 [Bacteroidetes bacterium]|nr:hypothetical protein [Bacteroidota bacterium]
MFYARNVCLKKWFDFCRINKQEPLNGNTDIFNFRMIATKNKFS